MFCKICGEELEKEYNSSTIEGYPVCQSCKDDIECTECYEGLWGDNLFYVKSWDKLLCKCCLINEAERREQIHTVKHYYDQDYNEICNDSDDQPLIDHLKEFLDIQGVS